MTKIYNFYLYLLYCIFGTLFIFLLLFPSELIIQVVIFISYASSGCSQFLAYILELGCMLPASIIGSGMSNILMLLGICFSSKIYCKISYILIILRILNLPMQTWCRSGTNLYTAE